MSYFSVKVNVLEGDKHKNVLYITKCNGIVEAYGTITNTIECEDVVDVVTKNYIDVFHSESSNVFYEVKVEFDSVDGKSVKELYLQEATSTQEAESLVRANITNGDVVEIISTVKKTYVEYLEEE